MPHKKKNITVEAKQAKFEKVMKEFEAGSLMSSSGDIVTEREQAIAIALSESGQSRQNKRGLSNKFLPAQQVEKYNEHFNIHTTPFFNKPEKTDEGFLIVDVVITEMGVLPYEYVTDEGSVTQQEFLDMSIFSKEFMDSCDGAPFVLEHPKNDNILVDVTPENFKDVVKGVLINPRVDPPTGKLIGTLKIWDTEVIDLIESKELSEVSSGYRCRIVPESGNFEGQPYDVRQTNMLLNHLALVDEGRAGNSVRVLFNSKKSKLNIGANKMPEDIKKDPPQDAVKEPDKDNTATPNAEHLQPTERDDLAGSGGAFNQQGDLVQQIVAAITKLLQPTATPANLGNPVVPAKVEPNADEIKDQVLNSLVANNAQAIVLQQMNEVQDCYGKAHVIYGADLSSIANKFNSLDGFRRHVLKSSAKMEEDAVKRMNRFEVTARYDVYTESVRDGVNTPRHNQTDSENSSDTIISINDFVNG